MLYINIRHRARACEARSGRGCLPSEASSTISTSKDPMPPMPNDSNDGCSVPMLDASTFNIKAARPYFHLPLLTLEPLFRLPTSASNLDSFSNPQNPTFDAQNPPKTFPKRLPNSFFCSNARNVQKLYNYYAKTTFLLLQSLQKSFQNRCQNAFKISFILDTLLEP